MRCGRRPRPPFNDEKQNLLQYFSWDGDLGHLNGDIAVVAHHFTPILISFFSRLDSDKSLIGPELADVRNKLSGL